MNKKKTLVELTEQEFVKNIFSVIEEYDEQLCEIKKEQGQFYKLYRNYLLDKNSTKFDLKFYIQDSSRLFYKKFEKKSIGYKRSDEK